jgi:hypothetical protein
LKRRESRWHAAGEALKAKNPAVWHKCGLDTYEQGGAAPEAEAGAGRRSEASNKRPRLSAEEKAGAAAEAAAAKAAEAKAHAESRAAARPMAGAMSVFALLQVCGAQMSELVPDCRLHGKRLLNLT